ncbi:MAG: M20/M25/M40 family metallo-hydrolase [Chitinophagaceae bacterium]
MKSIFALLILCCIQMGALSQTKLSDTEKKIIQSVTQNMSGTLQLLEESVNINSGTLNVAGVKKVGEMYAKELEALGFTIQWITLPDSLKRAGHLVAFRRGKKGKKLFLIGHLDTVFEPDMPFTPFTRLNDSTATGQGANDMKGGDVVIIAALKALHQNGQLTDRDITVYFTGDEENAGDPREVSRKDFIDRAKQHDVALAFETAAGLNTVATARRGSSGWYLEVEGKQAHSAGVFGTSGYGAIYEAARILNSFRTELSKETYLTFNPGMIVGGSEILQVGDGTGSVLGKTNIISPRTVVSGDLRFLSEAQKEGARTKMRAIVKNNLPGTTASIRFTDGIPAMPPTAGNAALVNVVNEASLSLGFGEVKAGNPGARGAGDISYVAEYLSCLDGLGASGRGAHAPGELINLAEYPQLIKRASLLIYRLTK